MSLQSQAKQISKKIIRLLKKNPGRFLTLPEIQMSLSRQKLFSQNRVKEALDLLQQQAKVRFFPKKGYQLVILREEENGVFQANPKGFGYVRTPTGDVFIPSAKVHGAMHGDEVKTRLRKRAKFRGETPIGEVVAVIKRVNTRIVGRFERRRNFAIVTPANRRIFYEIVIPPRYIQEADTGDAVVVEIEHWPTRDRLPEGKVVDVIGKETAPGTDITMIVLSHNWPTQFSPKALAEASEVPSQVRKKDLNQRKDWRSLYTVTIDGLDAKDFDDALSLQVDERGYFKLWVHIADVTYYLDRVPALNDDALARATSLYLPDRVLPMLPPPLSTGICSLNPLVDRLSFTVYMEVNPDGEVEGFEISEGIIQSKARLTYEEVDQLFVRGKFKEPVLEHFLLSLQLLSEILEKKRLARGSLQFETIEPKVILDENLWPREIKVRERTPATQLIEEVMILANETIAEFMFQKEAPMIYRIHERPDPEAVFGIGQLVKELGYPIKSLKDAHPRTFQALIDFAHTRPERLLINSLLLRAMTQARYAASSSGHFGLAAEHYTHFTSPIRRYPDVIVHRLVKAVLKGQFKEVRPVPHLTERFFAPIGAQNDNRGMAPENKLLENLEELARHCSVQEREAEEIEREAVEIKICQYMLGQIGKDFDAVISGVSSYGFWVELENSAEGLVHVRSLTSDYFKFEPEKYLLKGERSGQTFRLGQRVKVKLVNVSLAQRELDFVVVE